MDDLRRCPACDSPASHWAAAQVLGEFDASYERCVECGCVFASNVTWLDRAYDEAIAQSDIGLLDRCIVLSHVTSALLTAMKVSKTAPLLDWAGGYGAFTRMMRDRGYHFSDHDKFAQNIFAGPHRKSALSPGDRYAAVTAFEVLEHLTDPLVDLREVSQATDILILTTQTLPTPTPTPTSWEYYALDTGQHVTFYTHRTLEELGARLGFQYVVSGPLVHVLCRRPIPRLARLMATRHQLGYLVGLGLSAGQRRSGLLAHDYHAVHGDDRP